MKTLLAILFLLWSALAFAQVAINTDGAIPDNSAMLDVKSTNKGMLIPRIALTGTNDATTIVTPATSLLVYNTATVSDVTPGFYYWNGTASWVRLTTGGVASNPLITPGTNTKITYDAKGLVTAGAAATTADIAASTNKNYVTNAQLTVIGNTSGINTGNQTITLTGDVTGSGTGSFAATIAGSAVTNAKMANMAANTIKVNNTASAAVPADLSITTNTFPARSSSGNIAAKTVTDFALTILDDANAAAVRTTIGAGTGNGTVTGVTATAPLSSSGGATPNITITQANTSQSGYLSSADWNSFNNKVSSQWTPNGLKLYYNTGNVGIGTTNPQNKIDIAGNAVIGSTYSGASVAPVNGLLVEGKVGVGTTSPETSAAFDVNSTTRGVLLPRMTQEQRNVIASPATGLMIYQTNNTTGFYYNAGTPASPNWILVGDGNLTLPYSGTVMSDDPAFQVTNTGYGEGIKGISANYLGKGVNGYASYATGLNYGVYGSSASPDGYGVFGSAQKTGIKGEATGVSGVNYGVYGSSPSSVGYGVYGIGTSGDGANTGVHGETQSQTGGIGVHGYAVFSNSNSNGVLGETNAQSGKGVYGKANSSFGTNYGVYGETASSSGYSGYFTGGKFYVNGNVGIGTLSPNYSLDVVGIANLIDGSTGTALRCNGAETIWYNGTYFSWGYGGAYNYFGDEVTIGTSSAPGYNLVVNGTAAKTGGGSWSVLSDARLKNLSGNYEKGLNEIVALKPVRFFYKEGNPRQLASGEEQIGFIAQEVQKVFPEAVNQCKDGYLDFNMHSVNVAMVNAVKDLNAKITRLENENEGLKTENEQLKMKSEQMNTRLEKIEALMNLAVER